jgi:hypothetical protein
MIQDIRFQIRDQVTEKKNVTGKKETIFVKEIKVLQYKRNGKWEDVRTENKEG